MKKIFLVLTLLFFLTVSFAQEASPAMKKSFLKGKSWRMVTDVNTCLWLNNPDSIKSKITRSRGADVYLMDDFGFGNSRFGFSLGIGISCYDVNSNAAITKSGDTTVFNIQTAKYKQNKIAVNYAEIPLELYYTSKTKIPMRLALGFKAGYLISSHTKYKDSNLKAKIFDIPNLAKYRYGVDFHLMYGWFGLTGFYSLTTLFNSNLGPGMTPFSAGISIAPY